MQLAVVGVDGSEHSRRALEWAAGEARLRDWPLHLVHALPFDHARRSAGHDPHVADAEVRLRDLAAHARLVGGSRLEVSTEVADGLPTKVLVEQSRHCSLVVLGSRGLGAFERMLLGSTAVEVTARAGCPVAVIPATDLVSARETIVVGVDAAAGSEPALRFAFERADDVGAAIAAVHVWDTSTTGPAYAPIHGPDGARADAERLLADALTQWRRRHPHVEVEARAVQGEVVAELTEASRRAEVVVVGAHGRSAVAGTMVGSVSQGLLRAAVGPVVVAR